MKHFSFSVVFWLVIAVNGEQSNEVHSDDFSAMEDNKSGERSWAESDANKNPPLPELSSSSKNQERAKEEKTFKDFTGYEGIQNMLMNALKPKPIVDTAEESEKLAPNYGSGVQGLGEYIVRGTETLSRALSSALDVPRKTFTRVSQSATQALNQLGAYLVGL